MNTATTHALALQQPNQLALAISNPGALGTIEAYINAVNKLPVLTADQEYDLAERVQNQQDIDAAKELVLSHLRLVVSISRQYLGYGLPHADLIQEGNVGLMKAVKRFNPERGVRLVSFAMHWIKAEIHEYVLKNWRMVKMATTKAQRKLFFNLRSLKGDTLTLNPDQINEIAKSLNVRPEDVSEMEVRMSGHDFALDASSDNDEQDFAPIHYLSDEGKHEPSQVIATHQFDVLQSDGIQHALTQLDDRSRRIIEARWLNEEQSLTLHDLAAEFGVSAERIRQIEVKALAKMKSALSAYV